MKWISSFFGSTMTKALPEARSKRPTMGSLSVPCPFFALILRICKRLFLRWPPIYVSSSSTGPWNIGKTSAVMQMRRWFSMCSTRHRGMEVSRMTAFIVRSRTNVAMQSFHSSVVERIPDTGYRFTLNSRRHFLHFLFSLRNLHDRPNEQYGHVILVAMLDIPPVCGEILYAAAKNEDTEVANLDITLKIQVL